MKAFILAYMILATFLSAGEIKPEEHEFFTRGYRIVVHAKIEDTAGIYEARVYFKRDTVKDYQTYAQMQCSHNGCYAELPLTSPSLKKLNYVVVYQNNTGRAYKSKTVTMEKRDMLELPSWQTLNTKETRMYSEYAKPPRSVNGFTDNMKIVKTEQDEVLGVKAGMYPLDLIDPNVTIDCSQCKNNDGVINVKKEKEGIWDWLFAWGR